MPSKSNTPATGWLRRRLPTGDRYNGRSRELKGDSGKSACQMNLDKRNLQIFRQFARRLTQQPGPRVALQQLIRHRASNICQIFVPGAVILRAPCFR